MSGQVYLNSFDCKGPDSKVISEKKSCFASKWSTSVTKTELCTPELSNLIFIYIMFNYEARELLL